MAWKDSSFRWIDPDRFRLLDVPILECVGQPQEGLSSSLGSASCSPVEDVHQGSQDVELGGHGPIAVCTSARGRQSRHHFRSPSSPGGEEAWALVDRRLVETVCQGSSSSARAQQSSSRDLGVRCTDPSRVSKAFERNKPQHRATSWNQLVTKKLARGFEAATQLRGKHTKDKSAVSSQDGNLKPRDFLCKEFKRAMQSSQPFSRRIFLDLFAGQ